MWQCYTATVSTVSSSCCIPLLGLSFSRRPSSGDSFLLWGGFAPQWPEVGWRAKLFLDLHLSPVAILSGCFWFSGAESWVSWLGFEPWGFRKPKYFPFLGLLLVLCDSGPARSLWCLWLDSCCSHQRPGLAAHSGVASSLKRTQRSALGHSQHPVSSAREHCPLETCGTFRD